MPADPETLTAIRQIADEITNRVDTKLDAHQTKSEESTRRIYERIEEHSRESRTMQDQYATETRVAVNALTTQVTQVTAELHAHTAHDNEQFRRHDESIKELEKDGKQGWKMLAKLGASGGIGAAIVKWLEGGGPGSS